MEISKYDIGRLTRVHNLFLNILLGVYNCLAPLMYLDTKMLVRSVKILREKLLFHHHVSTSSSSSLCNQILRIQQKYRFPSIENEITPFLNKYKITDVCSYSKKEWKDLILNKTDMENREYIINWSKDYKKIDTLDLECEDYELKSYFSTLSLVNSRIKFRERSGCLKTCRVACPSDRDNIRAMYKCYHCPQIDTGPSHFKNCRVYLKIKEAKKLDLSDEADLMSYYSEIIKMRTLVET